MGVRDSDDEGEMGTSGGTTTHVHPFNTTNNKHGPSYGADGDRPPNAMGEDHWHDGTTDNGPNIPPYVKLVFLMKLPYDD